jgi:hypothetical protein
MRNLPTTYQSYLLRIWQEQDYGTWRASLTNVATRECQAFSNITTLYTYLHEQTMAQEELNQFKDFQRKGIKIQVFSEAIKGEE